MWCGSWLLRVVVFLEERGNVVAVEGAKGTYSGLFLYLVNTVRSMAPHSLIDSQAAHALNRCARQLTGVHLTQERLGPKRKRYGVT